MNNKRKRTRQYSSRSRPSRTELKFVDVALSSAAAANGMVAGATSANSNTPNPVLTLLNGIAEGVTPSTRIGRQVRLRSLNLRWKWDFPSTAVGAVRVIIFLDRNNNSIADSAANYVTYLLDANTVMSTPLLANKPRFHLLLDKTYTVDSTKTSSVHVVKKFRYLDTPVQYSGSAATADKIASGALYMLTLSGGTAMQTAQMPLTDFYSRIRYEDA